MSWRPARSLDTLRGELDARWPDRLRPDWTIGDAAHRDRPSDHNPNGAGVVCAIDVRGADVARQLWDHLLATRDDRAKYFIHRRRIVSSTRRGLRRAWTPRRYWGRNGHTDHIHVSVGRGSDGASTRADLYDDPGSWGLTSSPPPPPDPSGGATVPVPLPVLGLGSSGGAVESLQALLNERASQSLLIDGDYGPATRRSVVAVQTFFDVTVDGWVGEETWPLLFL